MDLVSAYTRGSFLIGSKLYYRKQCQGCGKKFSVPRRFKKQRYCTHMCFNFSQVGRGNQNGRKSKRKIEINENGAWERKKVDSNKYQIDALKVDKLD